MTDLIRGFTSSLLHLDASLVQCTGWFVLICLPRTEKIFEKKLDKLLAGFDFLFHLSFRNILHFMPGGNKKAHYIVI